MNIFEQAVRDKVRFNCGKGLCSVEDLWDLDLRTLDNLAQGYYKRLQEGTSVSFIAETNTEDTLTKLQFDLVKHVIDVKLAERDAAKLARERKAQKQEILAIIADKKSEALKGKSLEELTALLNNL